MSKQINSPEEMEEYGASLASRLNSQCVVFLNGDLGAGKTTLVRGFLRALGHAGSVPSPTFTIVETYEINDVLVVHLDLYRVEDPEELEYLALRDYLDQSSIIFIEWANKGGDIVPPANYEIDIKVIGSDSRAVELR